MADFGSVGTALVDASVFACCWMLGFAHRDGSLRRLAASRAVLIAVVTIGAGTAWALAHPAGDDGIDLNDIPLGQALVSLGAVLLVLRYTPRLAWIERVPGLGRLITVINARAVTIYLWHNVAIALAIPLDARLGWPSTGALIGTSVVLTTVFALGLGWMEDLAAGRRPALVPGPNQRALRRRVSRRPSPMPPVIGDGGLALPSETEESSLAALNALRPASDFRRDPRFAAPAPVAAGPVTAGPVTAGPIALVWRRVPGERPVRSRRVRSRAPAGHRAPSRVPAGHRAPPRAPAAHRSPSRCARCLLVGRPDRHRGRPDAARAWCRRVRRPRCRSARCPPGRSLAFPTPTAPARRRTPGRPSAHRPVPCPPDRPEVTTRRPSPASWAARRPGGAACSRSARTNRPTPRTPDGTPPRLDDAAPTTRRGSHRAPSDTTAAHDPSTPSRHRR